MKVEELLNVTFAESSPLTELSPLVDDDVGEEDAIEINAKVQFRGTSLTGFPAQSVGSFNAISLDSPYLLVLITGASQSKQHGKSESVSYFLTY
ncbi:hypothetical protein Tco_0015572 [Tanacetum coccineum]